MDAIFAARTKALQGDEGPVGKPWGRHTLLATTELLNSLLFVQRLRVERHADSHTGVILHRSFLLLVVRLLGRVRLLPLVAAALDDQPAVAGRHEPLEDVGELARYLLEGPLDGFVFALVQMRDQFLDGLLGLVELGPALEEVLLLLREAVVLLKSFLVDVLVFLEGVADFLEPRVDLESAVSTCLSSLRIGKTWEGGGGGACRRGRVGGIPASSRDSRTC